MTLAAATFGRYAFALGHAIGLSELVGGDIVVTRERITRARQLNAEVQPDLGKGQNDV